MMQPQLLPEATSRGDLVIRPAERRDRAAIEAIAAQIWDGDDYLPYVLDAWLDDPFGGLFVAVLDGCVIGVSKLSRFAEDEWWMEGLRIDPAFQGRGYARVVHHFMVNQARQRARGLLRFSTASGNLAVHRLAAETGFERVGEFIAYSAAPLEEPVRALWPLPPEDAPRVQAWLDASSHFEQAQRSLGWDWLFYLLTAPRLAERLAAGLVYGWPQDGDRGRLAGVVVLNPDEPRRLGGKPVLKVGYHDVVEPDRSAVAFDLRRLAAHLGRPGVIIGEVAQPAYLAALENAGFERDWDQAEWLFARDLVLTGQVSVRVEHLPAD